MCIFHSLEEIFRWTYLFLEAIPVMQISPALIYILPYFR